MKVPNGQMLEQFGQQNEIVFYYKPNYKMNIHKSILR